MKSRESFLVSALAITLVVALISCGGERVPGTTEGHVAAKRVLAAQATTSSYNDVVQQIYVAYFGRPADTGGLVFYENALLNANAPVILTDLANAYGNNLGVKSVVDSFGKSAESEALYGGNTIAFVTAIYRYQFNRTPDTPGLNYWANLIDSGAITRGDAAISIMAGARGTDATIVASKTRAASNFTTSLNTSDKQASYSGLSANAIVRNVLGTVNELTDQTAFLTVITSTINYLVTSSAGGQTYIYYSKNSRVPGTATLDANGNLSMDGHILTGFVFASRATDSSGVLKYWLSPWTNWSQPVVKMMLFCTADNKLAYVLLLSGANDLNRRTATAGV